MKRLVLPACLLLATFFLSGSANAQRLFVLIAADTSDEALRGGVQQNMKWIRDAFHNQVPKEQLVVRFLEGEHLTHDALVASISGCPVQEEDALVFWWLGRGEFEDDARVLVLPDGTKLARTALRDLMLAKSTRLSVLILDAYGRTLPAAELPEKTMSMALAVDLSPVFRSLFFEPAGFVEIDSANPEQRPLAITKIGGLLTCALVMPPGALGDVDDEAGFVVLNTPTGERELVLERGLLWRDLNDSVEWDTVLAQLRSTTTANYRQALGSKHTGTGQTPVFGDTRLKYADHFLEWQPVFREFRSRPRESRVQTEGDREVNYQGDREVMPTDPDAEIPASDDGDPDSSVEPGEFEMMPGDHLAEVNGEPVRTARQFYDAMQSLKAEPDDIRFVVVDNQTGRQIHYQTQMNLQTDADFGIRPWYWKNSLVIIHEVRPDSPVARAKVTRIVESELPEEVGLGVRGQLVEIDDPQRDGERLTGVKVESVSEPKRSDLKPGDFVFMIDGYNFGSAEGYRYTLRNARLLSGLWYVDGRSGKVKHGHVLLPHSPPEDFSEPPEDVGSISITPADIDSCPIW